MDWQILLTDVVHGFILIGVAYVTVKMQRQNGTVNERLDRLEKK